MKKAIPLTTLFLVIGSGVLTDRWDHHTREWEAIIQKNSRWLIGAARMPVAVDKAILVMGERNPTCKGQFM